MGTLNEYRESNCRKQLSPVGLGSTGRAERFGSSEDRSAELGPRTLGSELLLWDL